MFVDDRPLSTFQPTQGCNMYQSSNADAILKKPPAESPFSAPLSSATNTSKPPLSSKTSSSSSLNGLENNIPPFQTFLLRTPPLDHDPDKPLPVVPSQSVPMVEQTGERCSRRSSSVYSQAPSYGPDSVTSWQTEDLQESLRVPDRPIAYSISVPDLKIQEDASAALAPRTCSPLLTSPTMSTITLDSSQAPSQPTTALLPSADTSSSRNNIEMISLDQAKASLRVPGARILLPEEMLAISRAKSQRHGRTTSTNIFGGHDLSRTTTKPDIPTMVDRQGRVRSITTPPLTASHRADYPFPYVNSRLPSVNAFHVGTGPVREMRPPYISDSSQDMQRENHLGGRPSFDTSVYYFPLSPQTYENESSHSQLGDRVNTVAGEYHTLIANTYHQPSPPISGYDSDDSIKRHMKMIPRPLFYGTQSTRKSHGLRGEYSDHSRRGSQESTASSARGSNRFDLRLSFSPTQSRHTSGGSGSGYGDIPISPPSRQSLDKPRKMSIERGRSTRVKNRAYAGDLGEGRSNYSQSAQEANWSDSPKHINKPPKQSNPSIDLTMASPTLGEDFTASLNVGSSRPGAPLLTKSVIDMKLKTPLSSPQTSPLGGNPPTPGMHQHSTHGSTHSTDTSSVLFNNKKPFFQRSVIKSLRRARRRSSTTQHDCSISPSSTHHKTRREEASPHSPHLLPSPAATPHDSNKRPSIPHLGWSRTTKEQFDEAVSPPGTPTGNDSSKSKAKFTLLSLPKKHSVSACTVEPESPTSHKNDWGGRKASLLGTVLDKFTLQDKAQRRREDLKKMIRVVPNVVDEAASSYDVQDCGSRSFEGRPSFSRASTEGNSRRTSVLSRRLSGYGWM
ncbi:hypothetical protein Slin15195_G074560 [Septoria linicola]|uniref:Uncharacterized protein n=1 Tax=Septoria linicola TaxID=215465 RepID=A0A9Q9EL95_9PEZI|nr:hypothetical protein Slin14017_G035680 [Septoria linicola]USW54137.1 hypothetical protein Slin15195_G074560 [Septoria linicola]